MDKNNQYETLVEALEQLKERGYTHNFQVNEHGQLIEDKEGFFFPSEVELHEFHRFEGDTNPADMSILYAVQTSTGLKGTVVDAYGAEGSEVISKFMNQANQKQFDS
ncbi:phosphoribosylpyrophosphate synthetase [Maribellus comscasis]|uniref:Phosphoribosylpyrophosphate synthetase n=1 Tax=Maribellus comscasis TaxID=2681766 RepID=A0A6I6K204_9BACT|nr:phosphoribosylpyrophosphate synthetase [Maribellus comscasis]QGY47689.1 phosphoribosylpyrophosphate synthetase [Maribellus comscasis]